MLPLYHYDDEPEAFRHFGAGRIHHAHLIAILFKVTQSTRQLNVRAAHRSRLYRMTAISAFGRGDESVLFFFHF